jgi:exopolysaccharide biosynthesis polyprenyl glycosylphosphotransferase
MAAAPAPARSKFSQLEVHRSLDILAQEPFLRMLHLEQKRTERSRRRFVLMLLESGNLLSGAGRQEALNRIMSALRKSTRETDITGWYKEGSVIGTIFTEIGETDGNGVASALLARFTNALASSVSIEQINQIKLSFHVFPDDWEREDDGHGDGGNEVSPLYAELHEADAVQKCALGIKRFLDIAGSLLGLILLAPLLLAIAVAIKLTSSGPVLFRQQRVGQYGRRFCFLKFRSMYPENDPRAHEDFVKNLIAGAKTEGQKVYKMTHDPRITPIGRFLRRTSLDELPQLWNVLRGEMSLVGPRPPIPYEVRHYDIWHRRRLLAVKPGITGLWQVTGRSRVGFDEMVRLDLQYAQTWSLWLDLKLLLLTPRAVLEGKGAY